MYKLENFISDFGSVHSSIRRLTDMASIPADPANTDYQEFLRWCEQGNTPEPADE